MNRTVKKQTVQLGNLISALYDEVSVLTPNENVKAGIVYLALQDLMQKLSCAQRHFSELDLQPEQLAII